MNSGIRSIKQNDRRIRPLRLALILILCAAIGCGGDKARISSNTNQWDQKEISLSAPIALFQAETLSENWFMQWSPDSRQFAWTTSRDDEDILNIYSLDTQTTQQIELGGQVYLLASDWHPQGGRIAIGVYEHTRKLLGGDYPAFAEWIREYDINTGKIVRSLGKDELGNFPVWARYSPDGQTLVVNVVGDFGPLTISNIGSIYGKMIDSGATLLVRGDGSITTLAIGESTLLWPEWTQDGTGLVLEYFEYDSVSFLGLFEFDKSRNELTYHPISEEASPERIAKIPDSSTPLAYPGNGGFLRYVKQESRDDDDSITTWEIWEYSFKTKRNEKLLDLKKLFTPLYVQTLEASSIMHLPANPNWCLIPIWTIGTNDADIWFLSLEGSKKLRRLPLSVSNLGSLWPSPNGHLIAYKDESNSIKIIDISAELGI